MKMPQKPMKVGRMRIVSKQTPQWAVDFVQQVCKDYKRALPLEFKWINDHHSNWSSGWTAYDGSKILIRAGHDGYDQELVILHELAHHIVSKSKKKLGHSIKFWKLAFELYDRYGIELGYALYREEGYRAKATQAYNYMMKKKI